MSEESGVPCLPSKAVPPLSDLIRCEGLARPGASLRLSEGHVGGQSSSKGPHKMGRWEHPQFSGALWGLDTKVTDAPGAEPLPLTRGPSMLGWELEQNIWVGEFSLFVLFFFCVCLCVSLFVCISWFLSLSCCFSLAISLSFPFCLSPHLSLSLSLPPSVSLSSLSVCPPVSLLTWV